LSLVKRDFTAATPDRLWVGDITSLPTLVGLLYLAALLDALAAAAWAAGRWPAT
jgi:transposase InsO family protein